MTTTPTATAASAASAPTLRPATFYRPHGGGRPRRWAGLEHAVLAAMAFVPLLSVDPGVVTSDTKTYLYLDPARFLGQVTSMWLPTVALGTVTHQYVGYLFPMGPYYALTAALHVPTWIAQRLWLGGILFAAGAGVLYLCRVLAVRPPGRTVAALAFMLSPYVLQYAGRISVILLPWAGLPWLVAFAALALRRGGWRYPALLALVVAAVSGINASSALYVVVGPVLWLVCAVAVQREASWRQAGAVLAKAGALSVLVSAWWIVGLAVEAAYGVDVLRYTESVKATSSTSSPAEVLRGLGYWYFYGGGRLGPWTRSVLLYTRWVWLVAVSFAVPLLAFAAAVLVRWRERAFLVVLVVVGTVLSVGAYPYTHPTAVGGVLKALMTGTTAGLAMRSTDRATPLVLLGLAILLGAAVSALRVRSTWAGWTAGLVLAGLVVANNPAVFNGDAEAVGGLTQPASLPSYELAAVSHLDATHPGTRVLAVPGNAFAAATWGDTTDTPQPGLLTRPFVTREQQVMGSMATADTLYAVDQPLQTGLGGTSALAPMARLMSAGDVLVEYDQNSALYGAVPARTLAAALGTTPPAGLSSPVSYGAPGQDVAPATVSPQSLAGPPAPAPPAPLVSYSVAAPRQIARAESDQGALVVAGDDTGLESLATQGLLDTTSAVYFAGTLDTRPAQLRSLLAGGATLVVTDSNRKQGYRWNSLTENTGALETVADDPAATTPSDSPLELFPGAPVGAHTLATYVGAVDVTASSYGNTVDYTPEDRAYAAVDGNLRTAWETGTFTNDVDGQWWQARFAGPVSADHVTLVQPRQGTTKRSITKATLTFTGHAPVTVALGRASRRSRGQVVSFSRRTFRTLRVTIDATSSQRGTPVGFAEVEVPGQHVVEVDQLPTDLLDAAGTASLADRLVLTMTRQRVAASSDRTDPETVLARSFTLPAGRTFTLSGTATLSTLVSDAQVARLLGEPGSTGAGTVASSSSRLTGDAAAGAAAAADGDPSTSWQSPFGAKGTKGSWLEYDLPAPVTFDHMTLQIDTDRRHSVPTAVTVSATTAGRAHTTTRTVALPKIVRTTVNASTTLVRLRFPALTGQRIRVTVRGVAMKRAVLAGGTRSEVLPVGIAEVGIPGVRTAPPPTSLPATCRSDLLSIDRRAITVEVTGTTATALAGGQVTVAPCGADAGGVRLSAGHHVVTSSLPTASTAPDCASTGGCSGWQLDQLTLDSAPGGGPEAGAAGGRLPAPTPGSAPTVTTTSSGATSRSLGVAGITAPFELVLGESLNAGWHAVAHPAPGAPAGAHDVTLGAPELVDAFGNGWAVTAGDLAALGAAGHGTGRVTVTLSWAPQRFVWAGMAASAAALAVCLLLAFLPARWRATLRRRIARQPPRRRRRTLEAPRRGTRDGAPAVVATAAGADEPRLGWPVGVASRRPPWWTIGALSLAAGAVAAAVSTPPAGLAVAAVAACGLAVPRLRAVGAMAAVGLLAAAVALVVVGQAVHPVAAGGGWPSGYQDASVLASVAVAFLGADAVADYGRRLARRRPEGDRSAPGAQ